MLLQWWNLIFVLPFALAMLYLGLYVASGVTFGDPDVDADLDHDLDGDVDHDADVGANHAADSHADHAPSHGGIAPILSAWLGVGKVPLSIGVMFLLLSWGVFGFTANQLMRDRGAGAAMVSLPVAAVGCLLFTRVVTTLVGRYLPMNESYALRRKDLLGLTGEAVLGIDDSFGMAAVHDVHHVLHQVPCRIDRDGTPIGKGERVEIVDYDSKQRLYYVIRSKVETN